MTTSRTFHALHLDIASHSSDRICYIILPERLKEHTDTVTKRYYFSLGEKEKDGKNKRLASVEEVTLEAVDLLKSALRKTIVTQRTGAYGKWRLEKKSLMVSLVFGVISFLILVIISNLGFVKESSRSICHQRYL